MTREIAKRMSGEIRVVECERYGEIVTGYVNYDGYDSVEIEDIEGNSYLYFIDEIRVIS